MSAPDLDVPEPPVETGFFKVLLAEDDSTQRLVLERQLSQAGYVVEHVADGESALARVLEGTFHILITDWDMPGIDGATLCQRIRGARLSNYLYILMLTAHTEDADLAAAIKAGANDFVRKPASQVELFARLTNGSRIVQLQRETVQLQRETYRLSITDPLLDMFNRRYAIDQLRCEVERAHRYQRPLTVLMVDLDHFKQINDRCGHAGGDQVLVWFTGKARKLIRSSDWLARWGGEEFVFVLPETPLHDGERVAEKLRKELAAAPFIAAGGDVIVTASFGVAALTLESQDSSNTLLGRADGALYASKRGGRNRVTVSAESFHADLQLGD
jgi:two-component system cell cycle response regulator